MKYPEAKKLLRRCRSIRGLTCLESIYLLAMLDEIQRAAGIHGNIFEIGIFHGRSLASLNAMKAEGEQVVCCDPNSAYIESSRKTLATKFDAHDVQFMAKSSLELEPTDLPGPCRLIRIDGLHTAEAVVSDLTFSLPALVAGGAIIIDDVFNENCPGVAEGLLEFQRDHTDLIPIVQGFGQTILTTRGSADEYRRWFEAGNWKAYFSSQRNPVKTMEFLGQPVTIFLRNHLRMAAFRIFGGRLY